MRYRCNTKDSIFYNIFYIRRLPPPIAFLEFCGESIGKWAKHRLASCQIYTGSFVKLFVPVGEGAEAGAERGGGLEAEVVLERSCVGVGHGDVSGLHGDKAFISFEVVVVGEYTSCNKFFLEYLNEIEKVLGIVIADIVDGIGGDGKSVFAGLTLRSFPHYADNAFDNVINIGEIAFAVAVVEDLNGFTFDEFVGEAKVGHIGTPGRTVYSEEAQAGRRDVVELRIGMCHKFVALFGGCIQRYRVVYLVIG